MLVFVGEIAHLLSNPRTLVVNLAELIIYRLVEADLDLVHSCSQRLKHEILSRYATVVLLVERVVLISSDQAFAEEIGIILLRSAAHHGSVLDSLIIA